MAEQKSPTTTLEPTPKDNALDIAICALRTIAFQGYSIPKELADKAIKEISELLKT